MKSRALRGRAHRRPRVLFSFARPTEWTNPFTGNLANELASEVDVSFLSPGAMLWGRFDILHVHWAENLFVSSSPLKTALRTVLGLILLARLVVARRPVVMTRHNVTPHESQHRIHNRLTRWLERRSIATIYLNESPENDPAGGVTILHGDYPPALRLAAKSRKRDGGISLLSYGLMRRYKGLDDLIRAFRALPRGDAELRIMGPAPVKEYLAEIVALAVGDSRVFIDAGFVSDDELEAAIANCDAVVLPYPQLYNSGAALLALSRGKAIIAPDGGATRSLRDEVGAEFVYLFAPPFDAEDLERALTSIPGPRGGCPDLSRRDWAGIAALHANLYRKMWAVRGRGIIAARHAIRVYVAQDRAFVRHSQRNTLVAGVDRV